MKNKLVPKSIMVLKSSVCLNNATIVQSFSVNLFESLFFTSKLIFYVYSLVLADVVWEGEFGVSGKGFEKIISPSDSKFWLELSME